jgi:hypothetical protein
VLPVFVRMLVRMVMLVKTHVNRGCPHLLGWPPAREVTVSAAMPVGVDMSSVPVSGSDAHWQTVAWPSPTATPGDEGAESEMPYAIRSKES